MHGWCVAIHKIEGGGLVPVLPTHTFQTDEGEVGYEVPDRGQITDRTRRNFPTTGLFLWFIAKGTDYACILCDAVRK